MADFIGDQANDPVHQALGAQTGTFDKTHEVTTAQLTGDGNRILMGYLPVGAVPTHGAYSSDDLDTGAGLAVTVGTTADPDLLLLSNTTVGQAAGRAELDGVAITSADKTTMTGEAATPIYVTFATDAATPAAGGIRLVIHFHDERT